MESEYNKASVPEILAFSARLTGKSLRETVNLPDGVVNSRNRGDLGNLVERYFFKHVPGPVHGPDFSLAGLELKTTGVIANGKGAYRAKERLVLNTINFDDLAGEEWDTSTFLIKCRQMLILFYRYEKDTSVVDRKFVLPPYLFKLADHDLAQIKQDWFTIRQKVRDGLAHEISEADTLYLAACVKGQGGKKDYRSQPFSSTMAKQRAFSFKASFVTNAILNQNQEYPSLGLSMGISLEEATRRKFSMYLGLQIDEIAHRLGFDINLKSKSYRRQIVARILDSSGAQIAELAKAGVVIKTVRRNTNGLVKEAMSFPEFQFDDLLDQSWEDSDFFQIIESKFLFAVFETSADGSSEVLARVFYWQMPMGDREEARRVWELTKEAYRVGKESFPRISESSVAHVRPHGKNGMDKRLTKTGAELGKSAFWLNAKYVQSIILSNQS